MAHGPSCSTACGIFPDQGSNPRPLRWQVDPQPLRHQGSPGHLKAGPGRRAVGEGDCGAGLEARGPSAGLWGVREVQQGQGCRGGTEVACAVTPASVAAPRLGSAGEPGGARGEEGSPFHSPRDEGLQMPHSRLRTSRPHHHSPDSKTHPPIPSLFSIYTHLVTESWYVFFLSD